MTPPLNEEEQARLNDTLISEIKAEMGRRDLSSRALGRLIGESSQYVSWRLDGGNPKTGKRTPLTIRDIAAIASALELEPYELLHRAQMALSEPVRPVLATLAEKRAARQIPEVANRAARSAKKKPTLGDE